MTANSAAMNPWYVGDSQPLIITLNTDAGSDDITGLSAGAFSLSIKNGNGIDTTGVGTFTVTTSSPAVVTYATSSSDAYSSTVGIYNLFVKANFGAYVKVYDPLQVQTLAS